MILSSFSRPRAWSLSIVCTCLLAIGGTLYRGFTVDTHRGGSYVESAVHDATSESTGAYLALVISSRPPQNISEFLSAAWGSTNLPPRPPSSYDPTARLEQTYDSRHLGGKSAIERAADSAWVAANRITGGDMSGVSSVLTVESISTKSPLYEKGLRPGDRIRSINEAVSYTHLRAHET